LRASRRMDCGADPSRRGQAAAPQGEAGRVTSRTLQTIAEAAFPTASPNDAKNSPSSFFAVESIRRTPSCASLPPIWACICIFFFCPRSCPPKPSGEGGCEEKVGMRGASRGCRASDRLRVSPLTRNSPSTNFNLSPQKSGARLGKPRRVNPLLRPHTIPAATCARNRSRLCSVLAQASATSMPLVTKCLRKKSR
jgi:hypothetical protein